MKPKSKYHLLLLLAFSLTLFSACKDIMEPSLSKRTIVAEAPGDAYKSISYTINFWWDNMEDALTYRLQVVTPDFVNIGGLVLDTVVKKSQFVFNLKPGNYAWRVQAQNGSSQSPFSTSKSFSVLSSSISGQTVQLSTPANGFLTNQAAMTFQWGDLYGATRYHLEIDTNNFTDEKVLVDDTTIPGLQVSFTLPKEQVYQWRVRAENDTVNAQWSSINTLTYDHTPPGQVTTVAPTDNAQAGLPVNLQWNTVATGAKYKVYVFKADSVTSYNSSFPATIINNAYSFNLGNSGDRVYWKISAVDAAGNEGPASSLKSFVLK